MKYTADEYLFDYRKRLFRQGRSEGTIAQRIGDLYRLSHALGDLGAITEQQLLSYVENETDHWSPAYRKKVYISYRQFFYWAKKSGRIETNPSKKLGRVPIGRSLPRPIPDEVILNAYDQASLHERAMLCLGSTPGLRRKEIASAHPKHREGTTLRVVGKGSKERIVPLDPLTLNLLLEIEAEQGNNDYYFRGRFGGHVHPDTVYAWVKPLLGPEWSTHNLRHRAGSHGLQATGDLRGVQELLGHQSLATTQIYTAIDTRQLDAIVLANSLQSQIVERRMRQVLLHGDSQNALSDSEVLNALNVLGAYLSAEDQK